MVDWNKKFKKEYDAAKSALASTTDFDTGWQPLIQKLQKLLGDEGFDSAQEPALRELRSNAVKGPSQTKIIEDKGLLQAVGAWTDADIGSVPLAAKNRVAALKLLRHVYLQNKAGDRKVWVLSLPNDFTDWPSLCLNNNASTTGAVKTLLRSANEHFTDQQRRYLGNSTQQALAWCQKADMVLATAAGSGADANRDKAQGLVRRWFADPAVDAPTLATYVSTLTAGFKKIIAALNKGTFVVTDWVPFRGTSDADELDFLRSEAFTFGSYAEGLPVVYIESNFFIDNPGNVLPGQTNWTRIIVHELTHLVCGTIDVKNGQARYAWYGIGPHPGYPGSDCIRNADNWAFFAADCAAVLTDAQRNSALTII